MNNKKDLVKKFINNKKSLITSIILLLLIVIGFSYAYFTNRIFKSNESFKFGEGLNIEFILDGGDGLNYTFDPLKMTSHATEDYLDSDTSNGTVSLVNYSNYDNVTCEYEVWFKAESLFENSDGKNDITIIATKNNKKTI